MYTHTLYVYIYIYISTCCHTIDSHRLRYCMNAMSDLHSESDRDFKGN